MILIRAMSTVSIHPRDMALEAQSCMQTTSLNSTIPLPYVILEYVDRWQAGDVVPIAEKLDALAFVRTNPFISFCEEPIIVPGVCPPSNSLKLKLWMCAVYHRAHLSILTTRTCLGVHHDASDLSISRSFLSKGRLLFGNADTARL